MSEPTLAELASLGAPLLKAAEQALAPEAEKVLTDLRGLVAGEMDRLRTELPAAVEQGMAHLHNLGEALLNRYHAVMGHIDGMLTGATPAAPAAAQSFATGGVVSRPLVSLPSESGSETVVMPVAADPTVAPSTTTEDSSAPSSTPSDSTGTDAPAV